jgi:lipopolysaccharide biosynthesis protein
MKAYKCAILYNNYYSIDGINEVRETIKQNSDQDILLLCSVSEKLALNHELVNTPNEKFVICTNKGKDIGGKLLLIELLLKLYSDVPYIIFLHDKKSYHKLSGTFEKKKLFEIINPANFKTILQLFESNPRTGIVCNTDVIRNEYDKATNTFNTPNSSLLKQLMKEYEINTTDYSFVAGTMFWVRASLMIDFFNQFNPIKVRSTLEEGNMLDAVQGTVTHSWERLLSWIVTSKGFTLQGIKC